MKICNSCKTAIQSCLDTQTFAAAHLYNDEKPMAIHIHDCYEIYFSISGGKQFLIDNRFYDFSPGDIFFINQYESHYLSQIDSVTHERIVLSIYPDYLKKCSSPQTDLNHCFSCRDTVSGHKRTLSPDEQKRFLYYIHKLGNDEEFGQDILDHAVFLELMTFLNRIFIRQSAMENIDVSDSPAYHAQIHEILSYINQHLTEDLTIKNLAEHFYLSSSHLCKIFKDTTGTTINRYVIAKRITHAKELLTEGNSVMETCEQCDFRDYSNFLKTFTRTVGISPKKYAQYEH